MDAYQLAITHKHYINQSGIHQPQPFNPGEQIKMIIKWYDGVNGSDDALLDVGLHLCT